MPFTTLLLFSCTTYHRLTRLMTIIFHNHVSVSLVRLKTTFAQCVTCRIRVYLVHLILASIISIIFIIIKTTLGDHVLIIHTLAGFMYVRHYCKCVTSVSYVVLPTCQSRRSYQVQPSIGMIIKPQTGSGVCNKQHMI